MKSQGGGIMVERESNGREARARSGETTPDPAGPTAPAPANDPWQNLPEKVVSEQGVPIHFDDADRLLIEAGHANASASPSSLSTSPSSPRWATAASAATLEQFRLGLRATQVNSHPGFDRLISLPMVREMEVLEHQTRTARTVLQRMRGRALLCDEVGLGKTVEAGLILSELIYRGLARNILILTPPSLVEQWQGELGRKFSHRFITHDDEDFKDAGADAWQGYDHILASYHTAKRSPHREAILDRQWDAVIIDEAHHLRNARTQLWKFASQLSKRFTLLLTATPVQNDLDELFNLVTLLEPGLLSTSKGFQRRFVDRKDKLNPKNPDQLHELLGEVMVRNRRSTVGLGFSKRYATTQQLQTSEGERTLYENVTKLVRQQLAHSNRAEAKPAAKGKANTNPANSTDDAPANGEADREAGNGGGGNREGANGEGAKSSDKTKAKKSKSISRMALLSLQMQMGSSSQAAASTLAKLAEHDYLSEEFRGQLRELAADARANQSNSKAERLLELLGPDAPAQTGMELDKLVVFTQFRATQTMLEGRLTEAGIETALFHGGLSRLEKERQIERFENQARVLLTTDSGSEGRNLQFCNAICNFDLPWNPMRIEQRIGRLSRIGQAREVHVINLVAAGTVESAILHLLEAKLAMFEMVVGEIDMVLGNLDQEQDFADMVADLWRDSTGLDDFAQRMETLGDRMVQAKQQYVQQQAVDNKIFGDNFRPEG